MCGLANSNGAPLDNLDVPTTYRAGTGDRPLEHAFILDTEDDVYTKMAVCCNECGNELELIAIEERAEVAVILSVGTCSKCTGDAHADGYQRAADDTRGF